MSSAAPGSNTLTMHGAGIEDVECLEQRLLHLGTRFVCVCVCHENLTEVGCWFVQTPVACLPRVQQVSGSQCKQRSGCTLNPELKPLTSKSQALHPSTLTPTPPETLNPKS